MRKALFVPLSLFLGLPLAGCGAPPADLIGESFDPNQPFAVQSPTPYATPNAAEIKRGEDLENREAKEAEEKAAHANDPANQVKAEQEKIENQIQQEQEKAEGISN
jgi:hypothetical protein